MYTIREPPSLYEITITILDDRAISYQELSERVELTPHTLEARLWSINRRIPISKFIDVLSISLEVCPDYLENIEMLYYEYWQK